MDLNVAKQLKVKRNKTKTRKGTYLAQADISYIKARQLLAEISVPEEEAGKELGKV